MTYFIIEFNKEDNPNKGEFEEEEESPHSAPCNPEYQRSAESIESKSPISKGAVLKYVCLKTMLIRGDAKTQDGCFQRCYLLDNF